MFGKQLKPISLSPPKLYEKIRPPSEFNLNLEVQKMVISKEVHRPDLQTDSVTIVW